MTAHATARTVTDETFQTEVLASPVTIVVDFWADWCGPCRKLSPILDEIAREHGDRVRVAKLDVEANRATATAYGVLSLPTLTVFHEGAVVHTIVGPRSKPELLRELAPWLGAELAQ